MLVTSLGVIKSWSSFTEFPIFPDFQLVKHIPSICGQSLLIGLASELLKKCLQHHQAWFSQEKMIDKSHLQFSVNSNAILDEIFINSPAIRTHISADNSHPIITGQLLVMLTLKQSNATEPTLITMTFVILVDIYDILRWSEFFKLNIVDHMYIFFSNIYFSCIRK